jgi:hypothetical protein
MTRSECAAVMEMLRKNSVVILLVTMAVGCLCEESTKREQRGKNRITLLSFCGAEVDSCHFSVDRDCMAEGAAAAGQQRAPACCV